MNATIETTATTKKKRGRPRKWASDKEGSKQRKRKERNPAYVPGVTEFVDGRCNPAYALDAMTEKLLDQYITWGVEPNEALRIAVALAQFDRAVKDSDNYLGNTRSNYCRIAAILTKIQSEDWSRFGGDYEMLEEIEATRRN